MSEAAADHSPTVRFCVTGMSCAACAARVEKAAGQTPGVRSAAVNLLQNTLTITAETEGEDLAALERAVADAVKEAGYGAAPEAQGESSASGAAAKTETASAIAAEEAAQLRARLIASLCFLLPLMIVAMGPMWGLPLPWILDEHEGGLANAFLQFLLALGPLFINRSFFSRGFKALWHRAPNMDSLIAVGAGAAVVYGVLAILMMAAQAGRGDVEAALALSHGLYFESAAMIVTLITVGKFLEARAKGKTVGAIEALMALAPKEAVILVDGVEKTIAREDVKAGDVVVLKTGATIPVDGVALEGSGTIDESAMTGESVPVDKKPGDALVGATLVTSGRFLMRAEKVGEDTALAQIIRLVDDAVSTKAPAARLADKVSGIFVPAVMTIALLVLVVWLLLGQTFEFALNAAMAVLVISCPCALGLATPTAIMVGTGQGAKRGILFKSASALEEMGSAQTAVLDKTGTITLGRPEVHRLIPAAPGLETPLLMTAAALETHSEHPLARAVIEACRARRLPAPPAKAFLQTPGRGISGELGGKTYFAGNRAMADECFAIVPAALQTAADLEAARGGTPLFVGAAGSADAPGSLLGIIIAADPVKPDAAEAIAALKALGLEPVMLTGDNPATAKAVADAVGISRVIAGVKPQDKAHFVQTIKAEGRRVLMVGDGVNDAPALAQADVGAAIGAGTDVAIASADLVLMKSTLMDAVTAIELSRAVKRNIRENLFWAFFYNALGIPVAAGVLYGMGILLNPMIAAAAMSLSSVSVVTNALRLRFFEPKFQATAARAAAAAPRPIEGDVPMQTKTIEIEGMHCGHCTANVEKALGALPGVSSVKASLEEKNAVVQCEDFVTDEMLKATVEGAGFKPGAVR